jgi:hypothetical protein
MENYNDATKIWIEKAFPVVVGYEYDVKVKWQFATRDFGTVNLFNILASVSPTNPESIADFEVIGNTGNGDGDAWVWLSKEYTSRATPSSVGNIWVGIGAWGTWEASRMYFIDSVTVEITPVEQQTVSIAGAKALPDDTPVLLEHKGSSSGMMDLADRIYIEELDRFAGITVDNFTADEWVERNDLLIVEGFLDTVDGERIVTNAVVTHSDQDITPDITPLYINNGNIGGGNLGLHTPGVVGSSGLNNTGLLVTTTGRVVYKGADFFVIDDGGRLASSGKYAVNGVAVTMTGLVFGGTISPPPDNGYMTVTGLCGCWQDPISGLVYPLIRPRNNDDVKTLPE